METWQKFRIHTYICVCMYIFRRYRQKLPVFNKSFQACVALVLSFGLLSLSLAFYENSRSAVVGVAWEGAILEKLWSAICWSVVFVVLVNIRLNCKHSYTSIHMNMYVCVCRKLSDFSVLVSVLRHLRIAFVCGVWHRNRMTFCAR